MNTALAADDRRADALGARHTMQIAVVTETYPPEVNGVAITLQRMLEELRARQHRIQLVRLRQAQCTRREDGRRLQALGEGRSWAGVAPAPLARLAEPVPLNPLRLTAAAVDK